MAPRFRGLPSPKSVIFPKEIADSERLEGDRWEVFGKGWRIEAPRDALARARYIRRAFGPRRVRASIK